MEEETKMSFHPYDRIKLRNTSSRDTEHASSMGLDFGGSPDGVYDGFIGTVLEGPLSEPPHKDVPIYVVMLDSGQVPDTEGQVKVKATGAAMVLVEPAAADDTEFMEAREKYRKMFDNE
jgi:hypothetical protein